MDGLRLALIFEKCYITAFHFAYEPLEGTVVQHTDTDLVHLKMDSSFNNCPDSLNSLLIEHLCVV